MVNYHYKFIDCNQISFLDIQSRTYCIPINPVNTQMKTESCRTLILIKELCRQGKYFQNHIIDSLYEIKGYSNISHLRIQWCTPKYGKHLKYWIWWCDSFQSKFLFHYFSCVSNLSIYLCYIINLLDFEVFRSFKFDEILCIAGLIHTAKSVNMLYNHWTQ